LAQKKSETLVTYDYPRPLALHFAIAILTGVTRQVECAPCPANQLDETEALRFFWHNALACRVINGTLSYFTDALVSIFASCLMFIAGYGCRCS